MLIQKSPGPPTVPTREGDPDHHPLHAGEPRQIIQFLQALSSLNTVIPSRLKVTQMDALVGEAQEGPGDLLAILHPSGIRQDLLILVPCRETEGSAPFSIERGGH